MWFLRYEQSINPPVYFHFGILTILANSRAKIAAYVLVTAALSQSFKIASSRYIFHISRDWYISWRLCKHS